MNNPTVYYADINDPDETGSDEPVFCHVVLASEYNQLRAELSALKAGQGEAVYVVPVTGSLDEIDAPVWPFINAEAQKVGAEKGHIETYKYERANGGVAVLWDANRIHAMAVTIRDDMNRTRCIRMLTAPPSSADARLVPMELLERVTEHLEWDGADPMTTIQYAKKCDSLASELRALLARSESKVMP